MIKKDPFEIDVTIAVMIIVTNIILILIFSLSDQLFIINDYKNNSGLFLISLFFIGIFLLRNLGFNRVFSYLYNVLGRIILKIFLSFSSSLSLVTMSSLIFNQINFQKSKSNPLIVCSATVEINNNRNGTWLKYELNNFSGSLKVKTTERLIELSEQPSSNYYLKLHGRKGFFNSFCVEKYSIEEVKSK